MKKTLKILSLIVVLVMAISTFTGCDFINGLLEKLPFGDKTPTSVTVTWYNGTQVLKTQEITKGNTVTSWTPNAPAGKTFQAWYKDAAFKTLFNFSDPINEDTNIFAAFVDADFVADESSYYLIGDGRGDLSTSNWDHNASMSNDALNLQNQNVPGANVFSTTVTLYAGDRFQICHDGTWDGQVGIGHMEGAQLNEAGDHAYVTDALGLTVFEAPKNEYHADFAAWDITLAEGQDGVYKITYTTYADPSKNVITWELVEKLDASSAPVASAELYFVGTFNDWNTGILGEGSEWMLFDNGDGTWEGVIIITTDMYGDWTINEVGTLCAALKLYDKANDSWIGYNGDGNLLLKEGVYRIVYNVLTGEFLCEILDGGEIVEGGNGGSTGGHDSWYLRGDMNDWGTNAEYLLTYDENGNPSIVVELAAGVNFKVADANWTNQFDYAAVQGNPNFKEGRDNGNIEVVVAGTYTITVTAAGGLSILGEGETGEPVVPSEPEDITLYYYTTEWTNVNLYTFASNTTVGAEWPGVAMTPVEGMDGWYTVTVNASVTGLYVIFNDGTHQTADLVYGGHNYWVGGVGYDTLEEAEAAIANPPVVEPTQTQLYIKGTMNGWSDNADYVLAYDENGVATITVTLVAGDIFKVASSDWTVEYRYSADLGASFKEGAENGNIEVVVEGTYTITIANGTLTITADGETEPSEPVEPSEPTDPVEPAETVTIYYYTEWTNVNIYAWNDGGYVVAWPGTAMTAVEGEDGWYVVTLEVAAEGLNIIFNNGSAQTADLVHGGNGWWIGETGYATKEAADEVLNAEPVEPSEPTEPSEPSEPAEATLVYLVPNANWNIDGARFAAYMWNDQGNHWVDFVKVEGEENLYVAEIPAGYTNIIFCRMNPNAAENNWNNKWNQTSDLTLGEDNCYTVAEGTWDNGNGTWSVYEAPVVEETPAE